MKILKSRNHNKNKKGKLQLRLTAPVLTTMAIVLFIVLLGSMTYYYKSYQKQAVSDQRREMEKVVSDIRSIQTTIENISKQIVVSSMVQENINYPVKATADYFVSRENTRSALGTYTFIMDYITEILIYTTQENTISSMSSRDAFRPEKEEWYQNFKEEGLKKGYTEVHTETIGQSGRTTDVISYVLTYYSVADYRQELGDLIIGLDYSYLNNLTKMDMSMLEGYAIYNNSGEILFGKGKVGLPFNILQSTEKSLIYDTAGNVYLISEELGNQWIMVSEISAQQIRHQIFMVELVFVLLFLILAFLLFLVLSYNIRRVVEPINKLSIAAWQFGNGNFDVSVDVKTGDEIETLANVFNKMAQDVQHYTEMSVEHEKNIRKSQVDQLLLQINPHFIYNTLNSIVYMSRIGKNKEIEEFVNAFISLLQSTLKVEKEIFITLEDELKNVKNYIILQEYRYMDKFETEVTCPENLKKCLVPKVILQPIVENAIFHGLAPLESYGKLSIFVDQVDNHLLIKVHDNGIGMDEESINSLLTKESENSGGMRKIGIANVFNRIKATCGEEFGLDMYSSKGDGTQVNIHLPLKFEK